MKENFRKVSERITELNARETATMKRLFKKNTVPVPIEQIANRAGEIIKGYGEIAVEGGDVISTDQLSNGQRIDHAIEYLEEMKFINQVLEDRPLDDD